MIIETPKAESPSQIAPKTKSKIWRTDAQRKALVDEFATSGLTGQAFCQKHHIAISSLHKWRKQFAETQSPSADFIDISEPLAQTKPQRETPQA